MRIWLDGRLVDAVDARVSPLDSGFRLGDGVFSTLLALGGTPQNLDAHVTRTVRDASALGITGIVADRLTEAALQVAAANDAHDALVLRLVVTRGPVAPDAPFGAVSRAPTVAVLASPGPAPQPTTTVTLVEGGRRPAAIKSTSWAWSAHAIATARADGAGTALFVEDGQVLEGAAANVVVAVDGQLLTPPADGRILPGTTRAVLLERVAELTEAPVDTEMLARADEVLLTSAVRGAQPVTAVDDRAVGSETPGPAADQLQTALAAAGVGPAAPRR